VGFEETWESLDCQRTSRRSPHPRGCEGSVRGKSPEGKPQERYRHETRPGGCGRSKPARG
jgi:hypothetical protein